MALSTISVLIGMFIEIVGGLLLAIDAIGVERVKKWALGPMLIKRYLSGDKSVKLGRIGFILAVMLVLSAYAFGYFVVDRSETLIKRIGFFKGGFGFLIGLVASVLTLELFRLVLLGVSFLLLHARIKNGSQENSGNSWSMSPRYWFLVAVFWYAYSSDKVATVAPT